MSASMLDEMLRFRSANREGPYTPHQQQMRGIYLGEKKLARLFTGTLEHDTYSPTDGPGEGLTVCRVCGGFEAGMTDFCPGFRMRGMEGDLVYWTYCNGPNASFAVLPSMEDYNAAATAWNDELLDHYNESKNE